MHSVVSLVSFCGLNDFREPLARDGIINNPINCTVYDRFKMARKVCTKILYKKEVNNFYEKD